MAERDGNQQIGRLPLTPKNGGVRILGKKFQDRLINFINGCRVVRVVVPVNDGTSSGGSLLADIKSTAFGTIITLPPFVASSGGSSSGVPFSGAGAPSVTTLAAGSYAAGPVPSLYVDLTNLKLYVCTTAGTETTSIWSLISSASSGGWNARGVWVSGTTYNTNDVVTMGSGVSSGLFLSLIDANLNAPDSGIGWWQIGGTLWL